MEPLLELIRDAGDGAFAIDRAQRIVLWNEACEEILGYSAAEAFGQPCYKMLGGSKDDGCSVCHRNCYAFRNTLRHEPVHSRDIRVHNKHGDVVWLGVSTMSVPSIWSELSVLVHLIRDISVHKQIEHSLQMLVDDVSKLSGSDQPAETEIPKENVSTDLTPRELEVLEALTTGAMTNEISNRLSISHATTRNHIHSILSKLGVRNRLEAVTMALRVGLM